VPKMVSIIRVGHWGYQAALFLPNAYSWANEEEAVIG